jgi:glucose-1-phosphate adenylyltransferase
MAEPKVLVMVLAGGEGKRLFPLTADRAKPAVPFGGTYRLVDFVLSNFANARYLQIVVLTQYKSHSLDRHISATWRFSTLLGNYVTPVPAQMRRGQRWFVGSADAIYQNFNLIADEQPDIVCVFGADHIYRMDPRQMVDHHIAVGGGVTAGIPVPKHEATDFGVMEVSGTKIKAFHEKSPTPPTMPGRDDVCLASMGNYVFDTDVLLRSIAEDAADETSIHDLGSNIIPNLTREGIANFYDFDTNVIPGDSSTGRSYWRDVGTLDAYYEANMDLISQEPMFDLYNMKWPVFAGQSPLPPAKLVAGPSWAPGSAVSSLLCQGSIISGGHVERSVISQGVYVDDHAVVSDSIIMQEAEIGAGAIVRRAIVDKNVRIPPGMQIGVNLDEDRARGFTISDNGVVVIPKGYNFS